MLAVLAVAPLLGAVAAPGFAADAAQPIVASINPPPAGLNCSDAAAATSVYFQFADPPFQVDQISLYLDGAGVPQDSVNEHWPTVTLTKGLHLGSNTVDIVANGASGQHIERRLVVQVGGNGGGATGTAQVGCDDNAPAQQAQQIYGTAPDPAAAAPPPDDTPPPVAYDDSAPPPVVYDDQYYDGEPAVVYDYPPPVYVYNPYPVVELGWVPFVPFFGFGFFYSHYHPWCPPPSYGGGWYGGGGGSWNAGGGWGGGWHGGNPPAGGWNGWRNGANPPRGSGVAGGASPGWRNGANPPRWNGGAGGASPGWHAPGQTPGQTAANPRPGGWQGAPVAPRPVSPGGGQRGYGGPVQVMHGPPSAPQQYRGGGGGWGGGYRGTGWGGGSGFRGGGFQGGGGGFRGGGGFHGGGGGGHR